VRLGAVQALERVAPRVNGVTARLRELLKDPDPYVRFAAKAALRID
jgi:hypothetical protein